MEVPVTGIELSRREARVALVVLAIMAMGLVVRNGWSQDDVDLIAANGAIQQASGLLTGFSTPWWPPPWELGLYRPLARSFLTLQWTLFQGAPWGVHLTSLLLYIVAVLGVWRLATDLLPAGAAWIAAALFAVHPVHVEAVALGVNQGELVVAILATAALRRLLALRRGAVGARSGWGWIAVMVLAALLFKEHAVVIPLLLLAADLSLPLPAGALSWRTRWPGYLGLVVLVTGFWGVRALVLGDLAGAPPASGLVPELVPRALTMLGVVPIWARLFFWPAQLQADYAPMEIVPWNGWTGAQTLGLLLLLAWIGMFVWGWRRSRPVAFAVLWIGIALIPVSNILLPTGILAAERVLFLPSVGVALLLAAGAAALVPARSDRTARLVQVTGGALLLGLGMIRCATRMPVWHDQGSHIAALYQDAPRSYRSQIAAGTFRYEVLGDRRGGEELLRAAIAIWPTDPWPYQELADRYRLDGICAPAEELYGKAMALAPGWPGLRLGLIACFFHEGRWTEAAAIARSPMIHDPDRVGFERIAALADSAAQARSAPGSVPLPLTPNELTRVGPRRGS